MVSEEKKLQEFTTNIPQNTLSAFRGWLFGHAGGGGVKGQNKESMHMSYSGK